MCCLMKAKTSVSTHRLSANFLVEKVFAKMQEKDTELVKNKTVNSG